MLLTVKQRAESDSPSLIRIKSANWRWLAAALVFTAVLQVHSIAFAQFGTVVNLPADASPPSIFPGTQLNIFEGGRLFSDVSSPFRAYGGEVNVVGGEVGSYYRGHGSSVLNIHDGRVGSLSAYDNSSVNMRGGLLEHSLEIFDSGKATWSGGVIGGSVSASTHAKLSVVGGEFRLNGAPIPALTAIGSSQNINLPYESTLSGILSDGTPFVLSGQNVDPIADGTLSLETVALPDKGPNEIVVSGTSTLHGIRAGQSLIVTDGGSIGPLFAASWDSILRVTGGRVGAGAEAIGVQIEITGGEVDQYFQAFNGTVVNLTSGTVGPVFNAFRGSTVNISGGEVGETFRAWDGSRVRISGGRVGSGFLAFYGSDVAISGGSVGERLSLINGSSATLSGGSFGDGIRADAGSKLTLVGSEFTLNGVPVDNATTVPVAWTRGSTLTGVLADGMPIVISQLDEDRIDAGTLYLDFTMPPPLERLSFELPGDPAPQGLHSSQSLIIRSGGEIGDNFTALASTRLQISGGTVGKNLEAAGATISLSEGRIGQKFDACLRSVLVVSGGEIGDYSSASGESEVQQSGGVIGDSFVLSHRSRMTISSGLVGDKFAIRSGSVLDFFDGSIKDYLDVGDRPQDGVPLGGDLAATANIHGGQVGNSISVLSNGRLNIFGGTFAGGVLATPRSEVRIYGKRFFIGGQEVDEIELGMPLAVESRNISVRALLQDGNEIILNLSTKVGSIDYFSPNAKLWLVLTHSVPEPSSAAMMSVVIGTLSICRGLVAGRRRHQPS